MNGRRPACLRHSCKQMIELPFSPHGPRKNSDRHTSSTLIKTNPPPHPPPPAPLFFTSTGPFSISTHFSNHLISLLPLSLFFPHLAFLASVVLSLRRPPSSSLSPPCVRPPPLAKSHLSRFIRRCVPCGIAVSSGYRKKMKQI